MPASIWDYLEVAPGPDGPELRLKQKMDGWSVSTKTCLSDPTAANTDLNNEKSSVGLVDFFQTLISVYDGNGNIVAEKPVVFKVTMEVHEGGPPPSGE